MGAHRNFPEEVGAKLVKLKKSTIFRRAKGKINHFWHRRRKRNFFAFLRRFRLNLSMFITSAEGAVENFSVFRRRAPYGVIFFQFQGASYPLHAHDCNDNEILWCNYARQATNEQLSSLDTHERRQYISWGLVKEGQTQCTECERRIAQSSRGCMITPTFAVNYPYQVAFSRWRHSPCQADAHVRTPHFKQIYAFTMLKKLGYFSQEQYMTSSFSNSMGQLPQVAPPLRSPMIVTAI